MATKPASIRDETDEDAPPVQGESRSIQGERQEIQGLQNVIRPKWPNPVTFIEDDEDPFAYGMGDKFVCTIVDGREYQARDFDTKDPMMWPSGDPLMILVVIGTDVTTGDDCSVFIQGRELTKAFQDALNKAGVKGIAPGDILEVTWSGEHETPRDPKKKSRAELSMTKEYEVSLIPV